MYALALSERLSVESRGGILRLGLVHYNTPEEVDAVVDCLRKM
jgi:selenocysteine lyase/cysteine desulfurase